MTDYDDCTFCGGRVQGRLVTKACWWGEQLLAIVENVPAGVCDQCGERYYKAYVLKEIEAMLNKRETFGSVKVRLGSFEPRDLIRNPKPVMSLVEGSETL